MEAIAYTLIRIDGDYALLITASGDENRVARALLPDNSDEGDRIIYHDFMFSKENGEMESDGR